MTQFGERRRTFVLLIKTHLIRLKGQPSLKHGANDGRIFLLLMSNIVSGYKYHHWMCSVYDCDEHVYLLGWEPTNQPSPISYLPPRGFYASRNHCRVQSIFTFAIIILISTIHPVNFWRVLENFSWRFKFVPHI